MNDFEKCVKSRKIILALGVKKSVRSELKEAKKEEDCFFFQAEDGIRDKGM